MMNKDNDILFIELVKNIFQFSTNSFAGIGLLMYHYIKRMNKYHCNLVGSYNFVPKLHIGSFALVEYLLHISSSYNPYHDGFHFINHHGYLSHVSQFVSPPINKTYLNIHGQGSRTLCSINTSTIDGVNMVATISSKRNIFLFKNGQISTLSFSKRDYDLVY